MTSNRLNRAFTLAIAAGLATGVFANGTIIGKVETEAGAAISHAVVNIQDATGAFKPGTYVMDQVDKQFSPRVLAISKGSTVKFANSDPFLHNVFSSSRVKTFNVSQASKGDTSELEFDKVGIVPIKCHIHANMSAYIVVVPNPYFAVTNSKGLFRIDNLPAGTYTIKVWTTAGKVSTQSIQVPDSGDAKVIFKV